MKQIITILWCVISLFSAPTHSGRTLIAASPSYADVKQAYDSCKTGSVLIIPTGSATWTKQTLTIDKVISIRGVGAPQKYGCGGNAPVITNNNPLVNGEHAATFNIQPSSDKSIRISNIYFNTLSHDATWPGILIDGKINGSFALTKIRIDHCTFNFGGRQLFISGWSNGVADHNYHLNGDISVGFSGDDNYSWKRPIMAGTSNAWFCENDSFVTDNKYGSDHLDEHIYHQQGARSTIRYNIFNDVGYTIGASLFFDSHGNWPDKYMIRGQPLIEMYNNQFNAYQTYLFGNSRGGSNIIYDNKYTFIKNGDEPIQLREEEAWTSGLFCPSAFGVPCPYSKRWPAMDQINNSFFWNNTSNGKAITDITLNDNTEKPFIQKDRDYFMHTPSASGGYEYWPDSAGSMNMKFSSSGANLYYPYTPYKYPHPLVRTINIVDSASNITGEGFSVIDTVMNDTGIINLFTTADTASWGGSKITKTVGPGIKCTLNVTGLPTGRTYVKEVFSGVDYSNGFSDTFTWLIIISEAIKSLNGLGIIK